MCFPTQQTDATYVPNSPPTRAPKLLQNYIQNLPYMNIRKLNNIQTRKHQNTSQECNNITPNHNNPRLRQQP
jgi:hypothetical protein